MKDRSQELNTAEHSDRDDEHGQRHRKPELELTGDRTWTEEDIPRTLPVRSQQEQNEADEQRRIGERQRDDVADGQIAVRSLRQDAEHAKGRADRELRRKIRTERISNSATSRAARISTHTVVTSCVRLKRPQYLVDRC